MGGLDPQEKKKMFLIPFNLWCVQKKNGVQHVENQTSKRPSQCLPLPCLLETLSNTFFFPLTHGGSSSKMTPQTQRSVLLVLFSLFFLSKQTQFILNSMTEQLWAPSQHSSKLSSQPIPLSQSLFTFWSVRVVLPEIDKTKCLRTASQLSNGQGGLDRFRRALAPIETRHQLYLV